MNETLREMVVAEVSLDEFRNACRKYGMRTLRESGLQAINKGQTVDRGSGAGDDDGNLDHLAQFGEGEPPGEPVQDSARQEPRSPKVTKGHPGRVR